jgi:hypothetical protein
MPGFFCSEIAAAHHINQLFLQRFFSRIGAGASHHF